jgi:hypothetical protein
MSKYLYRLRYTPAGLEGTIKEGFAAREAFFRERWRAWAGRPRLHIGRTAMTTSS